MLYQEKLSYGTILAALLIGGMPSVVQADNGQDAAIYDKFGRNRGTVAAPVPLNANWKAECGSCHIAFEPGLLPSESWRRIMAGLDKHFGTDASVSAEVNKEITEFLVNNSNNRWTEPTMPLRITETDWFIRRHSARRVPPRAWEDPAVKSRANCGACHYQMEQSHFGIKPR